MIAATVFFLMESTAVSMKWKTSMNVGALVTLVAAVHYFYMREFWVIIHSSPILYRYIDWSITVPLQMIEFNLILKAVKPDISAGMFWRLLVGTVVMLLCGYCGESHIIDPTIGFIFGLSGWGYILNRDLQRGGWPGERLRWFREQARAGLLRHHALHRDDWLVYLPARVLLRVLAGRCGPVRSELAVQPCGLREQDRVLPRHLVLRQGQHSGECVKRAAHTSSTRRTSSRPAFLKDKS